MPPGALDDCSHYRHRICNGLERSINWELAIHRLIGQSELNGAQSSMKSAIRNQQSTL
jgi:hypothetical protein